MAWVGGHPHLLQGLCTDGEIWAAKQTSGTSHWSPDKMNPMPPLFVFSLACMSPLLHSFQDYRVTGRGRGSGAATRPHAGPEEQPRCSSHSATMRRNGLFRDETRFSGTVSDATFFPEGMKAPEVQETPKSSLKKSPQAEVFSASPGTSSRQDTNNLSNVGCSTGNARGAQPFQY